MTTDKTPKLLSTMVMVMVMVSGCSRVTSEFRDRSMEKLVVSIHNPWGSSLGSEAATDPTNPCPPAGEQFAPNASGILIGIDASRAFILTARHALQGADGKSAEAVCVQTNLTGSHAVARRFYDQTLTAPFGDLDVDLLQLPLQSLEGKRPNWRVLATEPPQDRALVEVVGGGRAAEGSGRIVMQLRRTASHDGQYNLRSVPREMRGDGQARLGPSPARGDSGGGAFTLNGELIGLHLSGGSGVANGLLIGSIHSRLATDPLLQGWSERLDESYQPIHWGWYAGGAALVVVGVIAAALAYDRRYDHYRNPEIGTGWIKPLNVTADLAVIGGLGALGVTWYRDWKLGRDLRRTEAGW